MRTILFLDFDGVLHPKGAGLGASHFSKRKLLEDLLLETACCNVEIVVSSTWRDAYPVAEMREFFCTDLRRRIIDCTPTIDDLDSDYLRYREIRAWLNKRADVKRWCALDDDAEGFPESQLARVVLTDPTTGLTPANIASLRALLRT